jgi:hypothetical protein
VLFLQGCIASCGALLVLAGASKIYRGARGATGDTAVRRALRVPLRRWRRAEPAIGGLECAVGVAVVAYPVAGGPAMAALGAAFCAVLGYARVKRVPGGCGCVEWRTPPRPAGQRVSWPDIARSAMLFGAGLAAAVLRPGPAAGVNRAWFGAGLLAGAAVLTLLSLTPLRTPVCHRPIWRPARATLRALTGHAVFAAMADAAGPFGPVTRYRRAGCTEEFWFAAAQPITGGQARAVVFRVRHTSPGGTLAVQASITKETYEKTLGADRVGVRARPSRVRGELVGPGFHGDHAV